MPHVKTLTIDQRIQVARIAADLLMHHCENLTSSKMTSPLSRQVALRNVMNERDEDPNPERYMDVIVFEQTFEWLYDTVLERVTGESDIPE